MINHEKVFGESKENLLSSSPKQQTKVSSLSSSTTMPKTKKKQGIEKNKRG